MKEPAALPCPHCQRAPVVREVGFVYGRPSRYAFKATCRKWFGLRLCFGPQKPSWADKDWCDFGRAAAVNRWNEAVAAHKEAS